MLSEKSYWVILIIVFGVFATLLWFWLIPQKVVEYNLGVNLLTSSIFMVLTVLFLSVIAEARRNREWRSVEKGVYETLGWHLKNILSESTYLLDFPPEMLEIPIVEDWEKSYAKSLVVQAKYLSEREPKEVKLSHVGENYLSSEGVQCFDSFCRKELAELDILMMQFERFWKPELVSSLMQLKNDLRGIVDLISLKDEFEPSIYISLIVLPIHATIKDACRIHYTGIGIFPVQT